MVVALQMVQNRVAEIAGDLPAGTELQIERMTPADLPGLHPQPDRHAADGRSARLRQLVVRPELARVPGAGAIEVQASDTREIEVDPRSRRSWPRPADGRSTSRTRSRPRTRAAGRPVPGGGRQHLALASGLWTTLDQIAAGAGRVSKGATIRVADLGTVARGAPDRTLLVTGNGRDAVVMRSRSRSAPTC